MASTNKTKAIGLPQWEAADKPERTDFNTAFADIDASLSSKTNAVTAKTLDMSLSSGFIPEGNGRACHYAKTQEGLVSFNLSVAKSDSSKLTTDSLVATFPNGCRPLSTVYYVGLLSDANTGFKGEYCMFRVLSNGQCHLYCPNADSPYGMRVNGIFIAAK